MSCSSSENEDFCGLEAGLLAAVALVLPLMSFPYGADPLSRPRLAYLIFCALLLLVVPVLRWVFRCPGRRSFDSGAFLGWVGASGWVLAVVVATQFSVDGSRAFETTPVFPQAILPALACAVLFYSAVRMGRESMRGLLRVAVAASAPVVLWIWLRGFGQVGSSLADSNTFFGGGVEVCGYLLWVIPLTVAFLAQGGMGILLERRAGSSFWLLAVLLTLQLGAVIFMEKRGLVLALVAGVFLGGFLSGWVLGQRRLIRKALLVVVAGATLLLGLNFARAWDWPGARIPGISRLSTIVPLGEGMGDVFRSSLWRTVPDLLQATPPFVFPDGRQDPHAGIRWLVGYGPDTVSAVLPNRWLNFPEWPTIPYVEVSAHSLFWDTALGMGAFGILALYGMIFALTWTGLRKLGVVSRSRRALLGGALGALVGMAAGAGLLGGGVHIGYVGLGAHGGFVAGLFLAAFLLGGIPGKPILPQNWEFLVAILVALHAWLLEANFSFATHAPWIFFWLFGGLLIGFPTEGFSGEREEQAPSSRAPVWPSPWATVGVAWAVLSASLMQQGAVPGGVARISVLALVVAGGLFIAALIVDRPKPGIGWQFPVLLLAAAGLGWLTVLVRPSSPSGIFALALLWAVVVGISPVVLGLSRGAGFLARLMESLRASSLGKLTLLGLCVVGILGAMVWLPGRLLAGEFAQERAEAAHGADVRREWARLAVALRPQNVAARLLLATTLSAPDSPSGSRPEEALRVLLDGESISPFNSLSFARGDLHLKSGLASPDPATRQQNLLTAREAYLRAARAIPDNEAAWFSCAVVSRLLASGETPEYQNKADRIFVRRHFPQLNAGFSRWGDYYRIRAARFRNTPLELVFSERGLQFYDRSISNALTTLPDWINNPNSRGRENLFSCFVGKGLLLMSLQRHSEAEAAFRRAIPWQDENSTLNPQHLAAVCHNLSQQTQQPKPAP